MPSCSPTTTNVGGSSAPKFMCPVYANTTAAGFGISAPPNRAVPWEPIAAAILAPAELPQGE
jgi:hypothetical protein